MATKLIESPSRHEKERILTWVFSAPGPLTLIAAEDYEERPCGEIVERLQVQLLLISTAEAASCGDLFYSWLGDKEWIVIGGVGSEDRTLAIEALAATKINDLFWKSSTATTALLNKLQSSRLCASFYDGECWLAATLELDALPQSNVDSCSTCDSDNDNRIP